MPASAPSPTTSQRAASSAPPAGVLPPAGGITCPSPQKTPTTRREILVALGETPALPETERRREVGESPTEETSRLHERQGSVMIGEQNGPNTPSESGTNC